jgi:ferritin
MLKERVEKAIIDQIQKEEHSSRIYLAMASWCESNGYPGAAKYMYEQANEERMHMQKLMGYVNDRGGFAQLLPLDAPEHNFESILDLFEKVYEHEQYVTECINQLYEVALEEKDHTTGHFLRWYIEEQIEEESTFSGILDQLRLAGKSEGGLFHMDKEFETLATTKATTTEE